MDRPVLDVIYLRISARHLASLVKEQRVVFGISGHTLTLRLVAAEGDANGFIFNNKKTPVDSNIVL